MFSISLLEPICSELHETYRTQFSLTSLHQNAGTLGTSETAPRPGGADRPPPAPVPSAWHC
jgi:hypothetical protein